MAILAALVGFTHLITGFDNRTLTRLVATLLETDYTSRQATYDLRRLRRKQLIERTPGTHRYQLTPLGRQIAVLFTKAHGRLLAPALAALDPHLPDDLAKRSPLATAWRQLDRTLDTFITTALAAA
jgi:predicted MarR family transcription regulator